MSIKRVQQKGWSVGDMSKTYTELVEEISTQEIDELYEYAVLTENILQI